MKVDELRSLLDRVGIHPSKAKGQNFLVEENLCQAIARDGLLEPEDVALEIGTGLGVLTERLLPLCAHVVSVEKDPKVLQLARERLLPAERLTLLEADALSRKSALEPRLLELVRARVAEGGGRRLRVVANLPYAVATPLVVGLLAEELPLASMTVMVQLEAAERFAARPGDEPYGAVSVLLAALCERIELLRRVPPAVFWPRPKVDSAVIRFTPRPGRQEGYAQLEQVVRALFNFRRKTLGRAAALVGKNDPALAWVEPAIATAGLGRETRTEQLRLEDFRALLAAGGPPRTASATA